MSPRIRILPDHVANQIAAGEVVERPASVVKELVENALDAGAGRVRVWLRNGGKTEIGVADDGSGMEREDALLALDRHATSKIRDADDLASIASFGFRGEALPSIAAVSRFRLETASAEGRGTRVRVDAGRVVGVDEVARRRGTTVTVRALFHNVPARAEFLRAAAAETRAASDAVLLLALSNLEAEFRLESNGRELLLLPAADTLAARLAAVWGEELAAGMLGVDHAAGGIRVTGLAQRPDAARAGGGRRYLFVEGRPFRDPALLRVADEAYRTTLPPGTRPDLFLYLSAPAGTVDVNVHPTKAEVRFRDRTAVEEAVREAILRRLGDVASAPALGRGAGAGFRRAAPEAPGAAPTGEGGSPREGVSVETEADGAQGDGAEHAAGAERAGAEGAGGAASAGGAGADAEAAEAGQLAFFVPRRGEEGGPPAGDLPDLGGGPRPELWQLHRTYILAPTRDGLLIVDQHSAHERILYEEVMRRFRGIGAEAQRLLFPATLRLSPAEASALEELSGLLGRIGFEIEPFGERTFLLRASPQPHPWFDAEACLREMIRELTEGSPLVDSARNQHERIAKSMACKGAIKAGQPLGPEEMAELFDRLFATELPSHDVHGRPTIIRLGVDELHRRFRRE